MSDSYPTSMKADALAALRVYLGDDADGLTDTKVEKKALRRFVKGEVQAYRRRTNAAVTATVTAAQDALITEQAAADAATQARKDAEESDMAAVETAFGPES